MPGPAREAAPPLQRQRFYAHFLRRGGFPRSGRQPDPECSKEPNNRHHGAEKSLRETGAERGPLSLRASGDIIAGGKLEGNEIEKTSEWQQLSTKTARSMAACGAVIRKRLPEINR